MNESGILEAQDNLEMGSGFGFEGAGRAVPYVMMSTRTVVRIPTIHIVCGANRRRSCLTTVWVVSNVSWKCLRDSCLPFESRSHGECIVVDGVLCAWLDSLGGVNFSPRLKA